MGRAVFLDRDGVITRVVVRDGRTLPPGSADEVEFLPGVGDTITALREAGFRIIVVTNQPDVATGLQRRETVEAIHQRIRETLPIDDIKACYHVDADGCGCRKPKPGMLLAAAREWSLELTQSFLVGDRWRDIEAGKAVGCTTILIPSGYDRRPSASPPDAIAGSLVEAGGMILAGMTTPTIRS